MSFEKWMDSRLVQSTGTDLHRHILGCYAEMDAMQKRLEAAELECADLYPRLQEAHEQRDTQAAACAVMRGALELCAELYDRADSLWAWVMDDPENITGNSGIAAEALGQTLTKIQGDTNVIGNAISYALSTPATAFEQEAAARLKEREALRERVKMLEELMCGPCHVKALATQADAQPQDDIAKLKRIAEAARNAMDARTIDETREQVVLNNALVAELGELP